MAEKIGKFFTFNQVTRVLEFATSNDKKSLGEENGMVKKRENVETTLISMWISWFSTTSRPQPNRETKFVEKKLNLKKTSLTNDEK